MRLSSSGFYIQGVLNSSSRRPSLPAAQRFMAGENPPPNQGQASGGASGSLSASQSVKTEGDQPVATTAPVQTTRQEKDSLGYKEVPAEAYYGIQALRGKENFPISGMTPAQAYPAAIKAFGWVKKAAAKTNMELGLLDKQDPAKNQAMGEAIMKAADEMIAGQFDAEFCVDVYQGGTGTSNHMCANEILANRATEFLGGKKGEYLVNPNDHVNYGQSTNDVTPTVMRLTFLAMHTPLVEAVKKFEQSLRRKAEEFKTVLIPGRTHMQDAVPLTLGQQFGAYANAVSDSLENIEHASKRLHHIGLGASALGTGLNTHPQYREKVAQHLATYSGFPMKMAKDYFQATSSFGLFGDYSAALRGLALELEKIAHDIKLYSMGPRTGLGEISIPDWQPGSSIMPGKVNPIYPELMDQLSYIVQGNDHTIALCVQNGQLQLNVMMPTILLKMTENQRILTTALPVFAEKLVDGVVAYPEVAMNRLQNSAQMVTALNPVIGYAQAAEVAKKVNKEGKTVREAVMELQVKDKQGNLLTDERLNQILSAEAMTEPSE
jgi:aspartate ammonia-lyase